MIGSLALALICITLAMFTTVCNKEASPRDILVVCFLAIAGICVAASTFTFLGA